MKSLFNPFEMQTGPARNQSMQSWLLWTGILELFNIPLYAFFLYLLGRIYPLTELAWLGGAALFVILLEGGIYWLLCLKAFFRRTPAQLRLNLLNGLYLFNSLLMVGFPLLLVIRLASGTAVHPADVLIGGAYYLFGLGEYLHYFFFKINMRPAEMREAIRTRQLVPARIWRERERAQREGAQITAAQTSPTHGQH